MKFDWNVTEEEYRADPALNFHTLAKFHRDPRVFKESGIEDVETDAMRFGSAFHSRLLTPDRYAQDVAIFTPPINPKTGEPFGATSKAYQDARSAITNKLVISGAESATIERMMQEYYLHPEAPRLMKTVHAVEQPIRSVIATTIGDVEVKGKIDAYTAAGLVDVKTTSSFDDSTGRDKFRYQIYDYKYIVQLAFYRRILGTTDHCYILAFEKNPPNRVAVYSITDDVIEKANSVVDCWLYQWKLAETGTYKSKYDDLLIIDQYDPLKDM